MKTTSQLEKAYDIFVNKHLDKEKDVSLYFGAGIVNFLLVVGLIIILFTCDPMQGRAINKITLTSPSNEISMHLRQAYSGYHKYSDSAFAYQQTLFCYTVTGEFKISKVERESNGVYKITSKNITWFTDKYIELYVNDISDTSKYTKGTVIQFEATFLKLNEKCLILQGGRILND